MSGRPTRPLALLLALLTTLGLGLGLGACSDDDDEGATSGGSATTTTAAGDGHDGDETTTTAAADGATTTTSASSGGPTSAPPVAEGDQPGDGVIDLTIAGGSVVGGVRRESVKQGSQVTLRVTSDADGEIHVHTYDLRLDLAAGRSADLTFLAKIAGVFEVELEGPKKKVLELEVRP
jgi:hypothetical protein